MCHGDSAPPAPPVSGGVAAAGALHLTAADGNRLMAYAARPERPAGRGVVLLPDFRGLHGFYQELAERFAGTGAHTVAIDWYGRSAGDGPRDGAFDGMAHLAHLAPEHTAADIRAAVDHLLAEGAGAVFTVGFCFGGSQSWNQSALDHRLAGAVGFYGRPDDCRPNVRRMRVPLLLLVAGRDQLTPLEDSERFDAELARAGVPHRQVVYPEAPHAFFDRSWDAHRRACDDAWRQVLDFMAERHG